MNWNAIGATGEIIGAIATVATLAYLALQIRHFTSSTRTSSLQTMLDGCRDRTILPVVTDPDMADLFCHGLSSYTSLEPRDRARFTWCVLEQILQMQNVMQLHDENIIADIDYDAWLAYTGSILVTPGGMEAWKQLATVITPTIRDVLQDYLDSNPDQPSYLELLPVMDASKWSSK